MTTLAPERPDPTVVNPDSWPPAPEHSMIPQHGPLTAKEKAAIHDALIDAFGPANRRRQFEVDEQRRTTIASFGVAGGCDYNGHVAYRVNPNSGTMVIAEGSGSGVGVAVAAQGFELAMRQDATVRRHISSAIGSVARAERRVAACLETAQTMLWPNVRETTASLQTAQIVGNKIVHSGVRPLFVFGPDDSCRQLFSDGSGRSNVGAYTLDPGRNIVVMSSGRQSDTALNADLVGVKLKEALNTVTPDGAADASYIAHHLEQELAAGDSSGTILVSVLDVKPWEDKRPAVVRGADYVARLPSTLMYSALAATLFRGRQRRELYETDSRGAAVGRGFARTTDLLVGGAAVFVGLRMAGQLDQLTDWDLSALGQVFGPDSHPPTSSNAATLELVPPKPAAPTQVPQTTLAPPLLDTYTPERTAVGSDSLAHHQASTVTNWSQDALRHYGEQAQLPPYTIDQLISDHETINQLNDAFYNDPADPDNAKVKYDANHWLNAGDTYSQVNQGQAAQTVVENMRHQLGLDVIVVSPPPVEPSPVVANGGSTAQIQEVKDRWLPLLPFDWRYAATISLGVAAAGGALFGRLHRRRKRKQSEARKEVASRLFVMPHGGKRERRLDRIGAMPSRRAGSTYVPPLQSDPPAAETTTGYTRADWT